MIATQRLSPIVIVTVGLFISGIMCKRRNHAMSRALERSLDKKRMSLLVSIHAFETYWAYYSMSDGKVYSKETKETTKHLLNNLESLAKLDSGVLKWKERISKSDIEVIEGILNRLRDWAEDRLGGGYRPLIQSKVMLWYLFTELKVYITKSLGLDSLPPMSLSIEEFQHTERYLRWYPHLPHDIIGWEYDQTFEVSKLSESQSIVIYGDIRRSQDLMLYTLGEERFEDFMTRFFESTRKLFSENLGIFDKFTGDGFLGYFNDYLCERRNKKFVECFLEFVRQSIKTSESLFTEWKKYVRKLPEKDIMLSLGADVGKIHYGDRGGHLVCMGDAIVWAERMCSAAPAGETYVNNLLANLLSDREDVRLSHVPGSTKTGESFLATKLQLT